MEKNSNLICCGFKRVKDAKVSSFLIDQILSFLTSKLLYFSCFRILFLIFSFCAITAHAGILDSLVSDAAYAALKLAILASGESERYADCFIQMVKWSGSLDESTNLSSFKDKFKFADFVCSYGGPWVVFGVSAAIIIALIILGCCCFCCCCTSRGRYSRVARH